MQVEWTLGKCCFCFPLRDGLIAWGYVRLIISAFVICGVSFWFYMFLIGGLAFHAEGSPIFWIFLLFMLSLILLGIADMVNNAYLVKGGLTKNVKYLESYFKYSCFLCILTTILLAIFTYITWDANRGNPEVLKGVIFLILQTVVQVYVILLVQSEIMKLKNNCHSQFENYAADSEYTKDNAKEEGPKPHQFIKVPIEA